MWLITPIGFFSVVQKPADVAAGTLTVRARVRSDIDALRVAFLPELTPTKVANSADYRFRAQAPKEAVAASLAKLATSIDYSNFKDVVKERQGKERAHLYERIWDILHGMQEDSTYERPIFRRGNTIQLAPLLGEAYFVKKSGYNSEGELVSIGFLYERRASDGELLEMRIEPLTMSVLGDLIGNSPLYFIKTGDLSYAWGDFESQMDETGSVDLEVDDSHPSEEMGDLQRVMEDAENVIKLVREGKPLQTQIGEPGTDSFELLNHVRPIRRRLFRRGTMARGADCDISIDAQPLKTKLTSLPTELRSRSKTTLFSGGSGIFIEVTRNGKKKRYQCRVDGSWARRIEIPTRSFLDAIKATNEPRLRLTYIAGRLFVNRVTIAATVAPSR